MKQKRPNQFHVHVSRYENGQNSFKLGNQKWIQLVGRIWEWTSAWKWTVDPCTEGAVSKNISWMMAQSISGGPYHIHQDIQQSGNWGDGGIGGLSSHMANYTRFLHALPWWDKDEDNMEWNGVKKRVMHCGHAALSGPDNWLKRL